MSLCDFATGEAQDLCLAAEAAQAAVPTVPGWLGQWVELGLTVVGLVALVAILWALRALPGKIAGRDWDKIGVKAGPVDVQLEKVAAAAQAVTGNLTQEILDLSDYVDRLLGGNYAQGDHFTPPTRSEMRAALKSALTRADGMMAMSAGMAADDLPDHPLAGNAAPRVAERALRILWVDDRSDLVGFERAMMRGIGHEVAGMSDTLLAQARIDAESFDLIVTDSTRDGDNGAWRSIWEAARREDIERGKGPGARTPVVVFTDFETAEKINEVLAGDTEAFATHSFAQLRWRARWLETNRPPAF